MKRRGCIIYEEVSPRRNQELTLFELIKLIALPIRVPGFEAKRSILILTVDVKLPQKPSGTPGGEINQGSPQVNMGSIYQNLNNKATSSDKYIFPWWFQNKGKYGKEKNSDIAPNHSERKYKITQRVLWVSLCSLFSSLSNFILLSALHINPNGRKGVSVTSSRSQ